ncbi:MAG: hypothetical protein Q6360_13225 [Candidatus Brocadiales bacterium]|nr:hypothetical protein [Candidatus Brocadiales bacterium]
MIKATFTLPQQSKARSARDVCLESVMSFLGRSFEDKRELGKTLRLLKGKKPSEIRRLLSTARQEGNNPPALFVHLCKR